MHIDNIFSNIPNELPNELFESLVQTSFCRIEKIVSRGHTTPPAYWYDQENHEWVILLKGKARLIFEDDNATVEMQAGDYVNIPAHRRHRVVYTDPQENTIWLAIHYSSRDSLPKIEPAIANSDQQ
jgi:cupin 2 domain-containing protein